MGVMFCSTGIRDNIQQYSPFVYSDTICINCGYTRSTHPKETPLKCQEESSSYWADDIAHLEHLYFEYYKMRFFNEIL